MNPVLHIIDDFFEEPWSVVKCVLDGDFQDFTLDTDGVTYPYINANPPGIAIGAMIKRIELLMGPIVPNYIFARAMPAGVKAPNQIHCDSSMGTYSAHVYLTPAPPATMGTAFFKHKKLGFNDAHVKGAEDFDTNNPDEWTRVLQVDAAFNRCLIHKADAWHCAMPTEGFGDGLTPVRLVITCFFDLEGER